MSVDCKVYDALSRLIGYPRAGFGEACEEWVSIVREQSPKAGEILDEFQAFLATHSVEKLEEFYTRTFDNSQSAALEIGWHLFGESYERGAHLVHMRSLLRELDIEEGGELPDHLSSVLAILARCDAPLARSMAEEMVEPAVKKICISLAADQNPYESVLDAVLEIINLHVQETNGCI
ncbi:MAG: nitrate reductase molybdenum cofactor assembly chaperone [Planctomycetota bacterium]|jgi:nitrate reductase delta subunit|nr:nitrate reductase molybdenum cofactor assembly chaperone [Planctomycetota bacterium]